MKFLILSNLSWGKLNLPNLSPVDGAIYILIALNLGPHTIQLRVPQFVN